MSSSSPVFALLSWFSGLQTPRSLPSALPQGVSQLAVRILPISDHDYDLATTMPRKRTAAPSSSVPPSISAPRTCEAALVQGQVDHLSSQTTRLRSRSRPEEVEEQLRLHPAVLSLIRRVPAEVFGEIFAFVLPEDLLDVSGRVQLVDLQLVCKPWRDAARLKHQLWSGLSLSPSLKKITQEKIARWFSRSGSLPKSLQLYIQNHEDCESQDSPCRLHAPALAALLAEGGSLNYLSLGCERTQCAQSLLSSLGLADSEAPQLPRAWESLKSIALEFRTGWNESDDPRRSIFSRLPPNITSLNLVLPDRASAFEFEADSAYTPLHIPRSLLEQLTSFSLVCNWEGFEWLECTLPFCTNVETLTLELNGLGWDQDREDEELLERLRSGILLPKVRTLRLPRAYLRGSSGVLCILRAPQLVDLDVNIDNHEEYHLVGYILTSTVLGFIEDSNCEGSFRSFRLRNAQVHAEELADTLRHLPFLTHLTLESVDVVKRNRRDTFRLLKEDAKPSLQHLEALELLKVDPKFSHRSLLDFLKSRRPFIMKNKKPLFQGPPDTLKQLTVTFRPVAISKRGQSIDANPVIQVLKRWCDVSVHVGPKTYVD